MRRALWLYVREAIGGLRRDWRTASLALLVVGASVLVLASVLVISRAVDLTVAQLADEADLSVFLSPAAPAGTREKVEQALRGHAAVADVTYVDPVQAVERFRRAYPDLAPLVDDVAGVPASFDVKLRGDGDPVAAGALVVTLEASPGVESVRYEREIAERASALAALVRRIGGALAAVLGLAAALTVFSVVRLSYVARRDEVEILYLVGAPLATIRGPYVVEGILQGLMGAALALVVLVLGTESIGARVAALTSAAHGGTTAIGVPWTLGALLLGGAALVGGVAAWLAVRSAARAMVS